MRPAEIVMVMKTAWAPWPTASLSDATLKAFEASLRDYSQEEALAAVRLCLQDSNRKAPPTPPELIACMLTARRQARIKEETAQRNQETIEERNSRGETLGERTEREIQEAHEKHPWLFD